MIADYCRFAWDNLRGRQMRSWLTMVGIFIGIAAVVALLSLGQGMQNAVDDEFEKIGKNRITVMPGGMNVGSPEMQSQLSSAKLEEKDVDLINGIKGVEHSMGILQITEQITYKGDSETINIISWPTSDKDLEFIRKVDFFDMEDGRLLKSSDTSKAVVGYDLAYENVFEKPVHVGSKITIRGNTFEVVGIHVKTGTPQHDVKVTIPRKVASDIFERGGRVDTIMVEVQNGFEPSDIAEAIKRKMRRDRGQDEGEEDFLVSTAEQMIEMFKVVLDTIQYFLAGIAGISLVVGAVGIMTSMYTSVLERTRQIGVMKSIGARNKDILLIFLIEAGFLGTVGGIIGIVIGLILSTIVVYAAGIDLLTAYYGFDLIFGALAFSFCVGALSGLLPARRAAKMNPVDALRYR
ncbi:MAG: ABC transporter permease [Candidatus Altiarchaeota archaeon]